MKPAFHYIVRAKLIRFITNDKIDFIEFEEAFFDESPIKARNRAFSFYQNYVDVLMESKNARNYTDRQARETLAPFFDHLQLQDSNKDQQTLKYGMGVFMKIDQPLPDPPSVFIDGVEIDFPRRTEVFIHGIGNIHFDADNPEELLSHYLAEEMEYYKQYNYSTNNQEVEVVFFSKYEWMEGYGDDQPGQSIIIKTPFDWSGYDQIFWWKDDAAASNEESHATHEINWESIASSGESNQVEYKPALLYNFSTGKAGIGVKYIIAKAICAFLNSNGGVLFIGVKDDGKIQGLDYDFSLADGKEVKDFFRLEFDQMLRHFLSFAVKSNVTGKFVEMEGKVVFGVVVTPNNFGPVFLKGRDGNKEFYVRGEASSRRLEDLEEVARYCLNRWGK